MKVLLGVLAAVLALAAAGYALATPARKQAPVSARFCAGQTVFLPCRDDVTIGT